MNTSKSLLAGVALLGLAATGAGAQPYGYGYGHGYGRAYGGQPYGYSRFTGRTPNYFPGLGLSKQTATGGPSGGSTNGGGGR